MEIKSLFKRHCQHINFIFLLAKQNFQYCYYMHNPDTKEELEYTQVDRHIKSIRLSLWKVSIIELAKLYTIRKTDKFNLHSFIKKLKPDGIFSELKIEESVLQDWERIILEEEQLIGNIIILRDKLYAHTDESLGENSNIDIYFKDLEKLIEHTESLIKKIHLVALGESLNLRTPTFDIGDRFNWIKILAEDHRRGLEKYFRTVEE